jgi:acetyl-CoA carboxylase biotin carboxyl carrier protein
MTKRRPDDHWQGSEDDSPLVEHITRLAEALQGTTVTDLELEEDGLEIRVLRRPMQVMPVVTAASAPVGASPGSDPAPAESSAAEMSLAVLAPLTGVFYSTPSPSMPPFAQPGDIVQPGQVVCIIEAMKVFNEIKTEIGGTVVAIPPKNGQLVKKGDPLVRIRPA